MNKTTLKDFDILKPFYTIDRLPLEEENKKDFAGIFLEIKEYNQFALNKTKKSILIVPIMEPLKALNANLEDTKFKYGGKFYYTTHEEAKQGLKVFVDNFIYEEEEKIKRAEIKIQKIKEFYDKKC